ncbi:MAG TPA: hypothetical protein DGT21_02930 [Armatimonadetes bacterium]|nr:hypothetical protein [Armatimonadota bacterium]
MWRDDGDRDQCVPGHTQAWEIARNGRKPRDADRKTDDNNHDEHSAMHDGPVQWAGLPGRLRRRLTH